MPFVSVILPHLDDLSGLHRVLTLLAHQTYPKDGTEIIVADNGTAMGIAAVRDVVGRLARVVPVPQKGAGPARNAGVREARGSVFAFIDSDCRPDPRWLEKGVEALSACDVAGGRVRVVVEDEARMTSTEAFERVFAFRNKRYVEGVGFTVTASMFVRRDVFESVGGFASAVSEDVEWCQRARRKGFHIGFAEQSVVEHPARRTMADLKRKWRRTTTESYRLAARSRAPLLLWLLRSWVVLFSIVPHLFYLAGTRRLASNRDRVRAGSALVRIRTYRFYLAHLLIFRGATR